MTTSIWHKRGNTWKDTNILTSEDFVNKELAKTDDLDNILDTGYYFQPWSADAKFDKNYPVSLAGCLTVKTSGWFTYQTYQVYNMANVYARSRYEEAIPKWYTWKLISGEHLLWQGNITAEGTHITIPDNQLRFYKSLRVRMNGIPVDITGTDSDGIAFGSKITQEKDHAFYFMQIRLVITGNDIEFQKFGEMISNSENVIYYSTTRPIIGAIYGIPG